jgi:beta-galactosidase/beta-glucuronidase
MSIPRSEYPRPQFVRPDWLCLNGPWQFEIDTGDSGLARGLRERELTGTITVPFCPESPLSGVGHIDFMNAVWYRRVVNVPAEWAGKKVLLHLQACDYDTTIWANDQEVARHRGGFTPITADLGQCAGQDVTVVIRARDDSRKLQPCGKQSNRYENFGCHYIRTTGIWQTVWLEPVPTRHLLRPRITPDVSNGMIRLEQRTTNNCLGCSIRATLSDAKGQVAQATVAIRDFSPKLDLPIPEGRRRLWSTDDPHLYDLKIELLDPAGKVIDAATSYAGLRSVAIDGMSIKINGKTVFQRLVLDQGYYPDGILTAPSDEALRKDIELSIAAGFNGARLHQKVFEERFLYWADKLGYLCWGEFADWGCNQHGPDGDNQQPGATYITQWLECLERDYSHPSIIGWCPLNETWQKNSDHIRVLDDVTHGMFLATKAMDGTRPVLDTSGYSHRVLSTDIYDCHDYEQDPEKLAANQAPLKEGKPFRNGRGAPPNNEISTPYLGQPFFVSEFGGIWWNPEAREGEHSWGYGNKPKTVEEFYTRFEGLCDVLLRDPNMFGYCYTQLTDVYQEQNGIYHFDRRIKFDMNRIKAAQVKRAAIES